MVLATNRGEGANRTRTLDGLRAGWSLPADEVHVWGTTLERPAHVVAQLRQLLTGDERARADRFRFERDRARYTVGRAVLRILLGRYLRRAPEWVRFKYGDNGKPYLAGNELWFNLSHSGAVALYGFGSAAEIGIDVELDDANFARERIAERFFSPAEVAVLRSLPDSLQGRAFLTCWTRKEAFIKARGDGLSLPLDSFDVSLAPEAPAALVRTAWSRGEPAQWRLEDLSDRRAGYIAAIALRSDGWRVIERDVSDTIEGVAPEQEET